MRTVLNIGNTTERLHPGPSFANPYLVPHSVFSESKKIMNQVYLSNIQFLSLYGDKRERKHANKILNAYFKSLTLQRKVDNEALSDYIKQGLPMTNYNEVGSKEAKQLMKEVRRDIKNRTSTTHAVVHFFKGMTISNKEVATYFMEFTAFSILILMAGVFLIISTPVPTN